MVHLARRIRRRISSLFVHLDYQINRRRLTSAAPDRLRRRYATALWQVWCYDELVALPEPAAGEPYR
jgi:hypothetical protein